MLGTWEFEKGTSPQEIIALSPRLGQTAIEVGEVTVHGRARGPFRSKKFRFLATHDDSVPMQCCSNSSALQAGGHKDSRCG